MCKSKDKLLSNKLFDNPIHSDITLKSNDGKVLTAHKNILSVGSDYFNAMFSYKFKDSESNVIKFNVNFKTLREVARYIYTNEINYDNYDDAIDYFLFANELCLENLENEILRFIDPMVLEIDDIDPIINKLSSIEQTSSKISIKIKELIDAKDAISEDIQLQEKLDMFTIFYDVDNYVYTGYSVNINICDSFGEKLDLDDELWFFNLIKNKELYYFPVQINDKSDNRYKLLTKRMLIMRYRFIKRYDLNSIFKVDPMLHKSELANIKRISIYNKIKSSPYDIYNESDINLLFEKRLFHEYIDSEIDKYLC